MFVQPRPYHGGPARLHLWENSVAIRLVPALHRSLVQDDFGVGISGDELCGEPCTREICACLSNVSVRFSHQADVVSGSLYILRGSGRNHLVPPTTCLCSHTWPRWPLTSPGTVGEISSFPSVVIVSGTIKGKRVRVRLIMIATIA